MPSTLRYSPPVARRLPLAARRSPPVARRLSLDPSPPPSAVRLLRYYPVSVTVILVAPNSFVSGPHPTTTLIQQNSYHKQHKRTDHSSVL